MVKQAIALDENFVLAKHILGDLSLDKNSDKSLDIYIESLKIAEVLKDKLLIGRSIRKIGIIYSKKGENDKSILYTNEAAGWDIVVRDTCSRINI